MEKDIFEKLKETNETLDSLLISNKITNDNKVTIIGNEIFNFLKQLEKELDNKEENFIQSNYDFIMKNIDIEKRKEFKTKFNESISFYLSKIFNKKLDEIIRDWRKFTTIIPNVRLHKFNNSLSIF